MPSLAVDKQGSDIGTVQDTASIPEDSLAQRIESIAPSSVPQSMQEVAAQVVSDDTRSVSMDPSPMGSGPPMASNVAVSVHSSSAIALAT